MPDVVVGTFGKALGRSARSWRRRARSPICCGTALGSLVFSTGLPPAVRAAISRGAVTIVRSGDGEARRLQLAQIASTLRSSSDSRRRRRSRRSCPLDRRRRSRDDGGDAPAARRSGSTRRASGRRPSPKAPPASGSVCLQDTISMRFAARRAPSMTRCVRRRDVARRSRSPRDVAPVHADGGVAAARHRARRG